MYGASERRFSLRHDNFDPSCFHTPVSNTVKQQLVNTLTEAWNGGGGRRDLPLSPLTAVCPDTVQFVLLIIIYIHNNNSIIKAFTPVSE